MNYHEIKVDLANASSITADIKLKQFDYGNDILRFMMYKGGASYDPTADFELCTIRCERSDGRVNESEIWKKDDETLCGIAAGDDGVSYADVPYGLFESFRAGVVSFELTFYSFNDDGELETRVSLPRVNIEVYKSISSYNIVDKKSIDLIAHILEEMKAFKTIAEAQVYVDMLEAARLAEEARVNSEVLRVDAENHRFESEGERLTAETTRVEAENERLTAELARVEAENERVVAELARSEAENKRLSAELERGEAEKVRVIAENERAVAEVNRNVKINEHDADITVLKTSMSAVDGEIDSLTLEKADKTEVGSLDELLPAIKSSLVGAINETHEQLQTAQREIIDLYTSKLDSDKQSVLRVHGGFDIRYYLDGSETSEMLDNLKPGNIYLYHANDLEEINAVIFCMCGRTPLDCIVQIVLTPDGEMWRKTINDEHIETSGWKKISVSASEFDNVKETASIHTDLISNLSTNLAETYATKSELNNVEETAHINANLISNLSTNLAKVATSGDYNDLSSIPIEAVTGQAEHFKYCITGECSDYTLEILNSLVEPQKIYQWIYNDHASAIIFVLCGATPVDCITQVALLHDGQLYHREYDVMEETWTQWDKATVSASEFDNVKETAHINANLISNLSTNIAETYATKMYIDNKIAAMKEELMAAIITE